MKKLSITVYLCASLALIAGCASTEVGSPCPDFGATCTKTPINQWNNP